jgi:hypothetical protein
MIKTINAGTGIAINGAYVSMPYISPGATGAGMVRWNGNMQCFEINDGSVWIQCPMAIPTIELTPDTQLILNWARQKMAEDARLSELAKRHPGIQDLKEKLDIMVALVNKEDQTT